MMKFVPKSDSLDIYDEINWTLLACSSRNYTEGVYESIISNMIAEIY